MDRAFRAWRVARLRAKLSGEAHTHGRSIPGWRCERHHCPHTRAKDVRDPGAVSSDRQPGGAGGNIGSDFVAKAPPDGYTLLSGGVGSLVMNPILEKVPYDTQKDFAPVILMATSPNVLAVHPSLPVRNTKQLIALAKSRPGELNYASGGTGSTPHLSGALFASMAGINIVHVPYKGMTPGTTALISGEVQLNFLGIPPALPQLAAGRIRALGVTGKVRSSKLPDVPTIAESALPGYEVSPWFGVLAPAGTAPEIVLKLNTEIARMMRSAEMRDKL